MSESAVARDLLVRLGVDPARIEMDEKSRDTCENAAFSRALATPQPAELDQFGPNRLVADRMPGSIEFICQLMQALGHPGQRPHQITQCRGLDKTAKGAGKGWILVAQGKPAAAATAHALLWKRSGVEAVLAAVDGRARQPGHLGDDGEPAVTGGTNLGGGEQPAPAFVECVAQAVPALLDGLSVDHASAIVVFAGDVNPRTLVQPVTGTRTAILLLVESSLVGIQAEGSPAVQAMFP